MYKNKAGVYNVQKSYDFAKTLAFLWKVTQWAHVAFIASFALGTAIAIKIYGDELFSSRNFSLIFAQGSIGDILAGFIVFELIVFALCFAAQRAIRASVELTLTWPLIVTSIASIGLGVMFMNIAGRFARSFFSYSHSLFDNVALADRLREKLSDKDFDHIYDLLTWYALGFASFTAFLAVLGFCTSAAAALTIFEARDRRNLPAKTLKHVTVREYDGFHASHEAVISIVKENLLNDERSEEEKQALLERIDDTLKSHQCYVVYEGKQAVGFTARSHDYQELLDLWIKPDRQNHQFGQVLIRHYLKAASEKSVEYPLKASLIPGTEAGRKLLALTGWHEAKYSTDADPLWHYIPKNIEKTS